MDTLKEFTSKLIELMGFTDHTVEINADERRGVIFIHDHPALIKEHLPTLVQCLNHLSQLVARKNAGDTIIFDINNYRKEREKLIVELAKAAARKVMATKHEFALPAMNAYERRLVHVELAVHPEVVTESMGVGKERYVIVKLLGDTESAPARRTEEAVEHK